MTNLNQWKIVDIIYAFCSIIILTIVVFSLDTWVITKAELPFLTIFDFIGILVVYLIFIKRYKLNIIQFYNLKFISLFPIFILVSLIVKLLQVSFTNGFGDLVLLYNELFKMTFNSFFHFVYSNISGLILAPIWEEFLFRGVIFFILFRKYGPKIAIFVPSLLFAFLHIDPNALYNNSNLFLSIILMLFLESILKSYIVYKTKALTIPTIMHVTSNLIALLIELLYKQTGFVR